ncbi:hypothetical protein G5C51_04560 [Streptomyces sp. A7024]|uniref:Uncharacterized protein n=1 Tax=Streptomyces coryli TaxID=1128680 RepID=A0A6G4TUF7_9ACTN|nr:hypothetical protein [Streptomyces coryli]NGN63180.1 hypothetical protein [Streptomyces coryli]
MKLNADKSIRQVQRHHVAQHAHQAIWDRRVNPNHAVLSVERDPDRPEAVILHVNSGGNAIACRNHFQRAGYRVEDTDYDPFADGNYGVRLRILPK